MSYMALYRKWRPGVFDDVKGQEHIVTALKNQIQSDRVGHAYLFCGTRGTGKTTVAKLFAKAVNCEHPVNGSPCGKCAACKAIANQSSMNVIEIDAASNNGVDNIREIRDEVQYSPAEGKYKVYIIDEVHMLSIGAFNALLKTLEEPPSYVIFILATTEVHKIPVTILSRCQRYDFRRISIDTITDRLMELMEKEKVDVEEKALRYIAKAADGSMRDALSLLDQCIAFYLDEKLTYEKVLEVLGATDTEVFSRLIRMVYKQDTKGILDLIDEIMREGRQLSQFITDFLWYLRNLLLIRTCDNADETLDMSAENRKLLEEEAALFEDEILIRYIRVISELLNQIRYSTQKRVLVEVGLIKLAKPQMETDVSSLLQRIVQLEEKVEKGVFADPELLKKMQIPQNNRVLEETESKDTSAQTEADVMEQIEKRYDKATASDLKKIVSGWPGLVKQLDPVMRSFVERAVVTPREDGKGLRILFYQDGQSSMGKDYFDRESHRKDFSEKLCELTGKQVEVEAGFLSKEAERQQDIIGLNRINMPITYK